MLQRLKVTPIISLALTGVVVLLAVLSPAAAAATATSTGGGNGYKISPVRKDLTITTGNSQSFPIYIQNVSNVVEKLQVVVNDFQANGDESGNPALLLNGKNAPVHGLKQFATVPGDTLTLQPNEQKIVNVAITIPAKATAGGYYGAVRVVPASVNGTGNVTLAASVAALVLVKVPGDTKEQLSIASIGVESIPKAQPGVNSTPRTRSIFTTGKDLNAVIRFHNTGDVQEVPFGKFTLKKGSKQLATYEVNNADSPGNVLPDSIRKFTVPLTKVGSFGKYTVQGNFSYGSSGQLLTATSTFYVIPVAAIVALIVIVALILFALIEMPRLIKRYNRRVLRKAGRR